MRGMSSSERLVARTARLLGNCCANFLCRDVQDFALLVCIPGHPLRSVLLFLLQQPSRPHSRRTLEVVDDAVRQASGFPRWLKRDIQQTIPIKNFHPSFCIQRVYSMLLFVFPSGYNPMCWMWVYPPHAVGCKVLSMILRGR